jgi:hypothetical protein
MRGMSETIEIKRQVKDLIKEYDSGAKGKAAFVPGKTIIPLVSSIL